MEQPASDSISERARAADRLDGRIAANQAAQQVDFVAWLMDRLGVAPGDRILEFCAGTGQQTRELARRVGPSGTVYALDISRTALHELVGRLEPELRSRVEPIESDLDRLDEGPQDLDLVFCAYGLYYSTAPQQVLDSGRARLRDARRGRIAVVGPHGENNRALFDLLLACDVELSEAVTDSSRDFMYREVIRWGAAHARSIRVETLVNPVLWDSPGRVLDYWRHSTFHDPARDEAVAKLLDRRFRATPTFRNEKWIMLVEITDFR